MLDHHMSIDQMTRSWAGHPAAVQRDVWDLASHRHRSRGRMAGDTLAEDLDLSYRAGCRDGTGSSCRRFSPWRTAGLARGLDQSATPLGNRLRASCPAHPALADQPRASRIPAKAFGVPGTSARDRRPVRAVANLSFILLLVLQPDWTLPLLG